MDESEDHQRRNEAKSDVARGPIVNCRGASGVKHQKQSERETDKTQIEQRFEIRGVSVIEFPMANKRIVPNSLVGPKTPVARPEEWPLRDVIRYGLPNREAARQRANIFIFAAHP